MSRVLLAWELGGGLGHIGHFVPLVQRFVERGHHVALALKDLSRAETVLGKGTYTLLQAPQWLMPPEGLSDPPLNYGEILHRFGYLDEDGLGGLVSAWLGLFGLFKPDLVIADHAPTALLSARIAGVGRAVCDSGFSLPPAVHPTPNMRPWTSVPAERLAASDARALQTIKQVLTRHKGMPLAKLADLFDGAQSFLVTFPELDHYRDRGAAEYLGALPNITGLAQPNWPAYSGKKILVYLYQASRDTEVVMKMLAALDCSTLVFAGAAAVAWAATFQSPRVKFITAPLDLDHALRECELVICHGGGTCVTALLSGRPLLMLPNHLEQFLMARNVQSMGAGLVVHPELANTDVTTALPRLLKESSFTARALDFADKYRQHDAHKTADIIVRRCEQLLV
jgi:UDP:flavonoid glycosyltransferase YjiC (YdhE family)